MSTDGGAIGLYVDDNYAGPIYDNFTETREQVPAVFDNLGAGPHRIRLVVNPRSGNSGTVCIDSIESPSQYIPSTSQKAALAAANQVRAATGLPPFILSTPLDHAAKGHADYLTTCQSPQVRHDEPHGAVAYIGANFAARRHYFGYDNSYAEVANIVADPSAALQSWMSTVYHRLGFMTYNYGAIGFGSSAAGGQEFSVLDFGSNSSTPAARTAFTWPAKDQKNVPLNFVGEIPDPFPAVSSSSLGYPISLHLAQPDFLPQGNDSLAASATLTGPNNQFQYFIWIVTMIRTPKSGATITSWCRSSR